MTCKTFASAIAVIAVNAIGLGIAPAWAASEIPSFLAKCAETEIRTVGANAYNTQGKMEAAHRSELMFDMPGRLVQREIFAYRQGDDFVERRNAETKPKIVGRTESSLIIVDARALSGAAQIFVINTALKQVIEARAAGYDIYGGGLSAATVERTCEFSEPPR